MIQEAHKKLEEKAKTNVYAFEKDYFDGAHDLFIILRNSGLLKMNTKDTPMDYKQCECGGDIIMFTPDLDICKKCGKQYEPRSAPDLLKENQSLKLELQKQKEFKTELVNCLKDIKNWVEYEGENPYGKLESLIKKSSET